MMCYIARRRALILTVPVCGSCYHNPAALLVISPTLLLMSWLALLSSGVLWATNGNRSSLASSSGPEEDKEEEHHKYSVTSHRISDFIIGCPGLLLKLIAQHESPAALLNDYSCLAFKGL